MIKKIVGLSIRTANPNAQTDIPELWQKFYSKDIQRDLSITEQTHVYAVYYQYEGDYTKPYSCLIGVELPVDQQVNEKFASVYIPVQKYQHIQIEGPHPFSLINTWQNIWSSSLKRAYAFDFEVYGPEFHTSNYRIDLYLSITS